MSSNDTSLNTTSDTFSNDNSYNYGTPEYSRIVYMAVAILALFILVTLIVNRYNAFKSIVRRSAIIIHWLTGGPKEVPSEEAGRDVEEGEDSMPFGSRLTYRSSGCIQHLDSQRNIRLSDLPPAAKDTGVNRAQPSCMPSGQFHINATNPFYDPSISTPSIAPSASTAPMACRPPSTTATEIRLSHHTPISDPTLARGWDSYFEIDDEEIEASHIKLSTRQSSKVGPTSWPQNVSQELVNSAHYHHE
ncbi:MAG: hypothetical protein M1834_000307 [Cirrosporium novae-zelandiae]|nr:MAG: hypothetical protein M1834_000307 [Cirrosporium novae-zelandiae]